MGQSAEQLINQAKKLPLGDSRRTQLLRQAHEITRTAGGQAEERFKEIPTTKEAAFDIAFTGLDIVSGGTFGKAAKGAQTGKLFKATPTVLSATEKVGAEIPVCLEASERS